MLSDLEFAKEQLRLPNEYITDPRVKAEFDAFCKADTPEEKQQIIDKNRKWMASLTPEQRAEEYRILRRSAEEMLTATRHNLEILDKKYGFEGYPSIQIN